MGKFALSIMANSLSRSLRRECREKSLPHTAWATNSGCNTPASNGSFIRQIETLIQRTPNDLLPISHQRASVLKNRNADLIAGLPAG